MPITAQKAQERYNQGTISNNMPKMFPTLQQRLANMKNVKATTVQGKSGLFSNAASISQITGQQPNGRPDTVYVETPKHMPFMNVQPRMAGQYVGSGDYSMEESNDYNVLGRRFNQAKSVSAKQQGGTMSQQKGQQGIEQQVAQLVQAAVAGDQQATQQIEKIMQAAQQGDQQAIQIAQVIQKVIQSMEAKQGVKAQLGAKLDYLNKLKGVCPEGTEKVYLEKGGCMCKKLKASEGTELNKSKKTNEVSKFKTEKKKCGGSTKKHQFGGPMKPQKPNLAALAKKPEIRPELFAEEIQATRDMPYRQAGYNPNELDSNMSLRLEEAASSGKGIDNYMKKWVKKNNNPFNQMLYQRFQEMGGPQMRGGAVSSMVGNNPEKIIVTPKPGKMLNIGY